MQPWLAPGLQQVVHAAQPLMEHMGPQFNDTMGYATKQLQGMEPLSLVALAAVATFVLFKLMGALRRIRSLVLLGVAVAYAWPRIAQYWPRIAELWPRLADMLHKQAAA